MCLFPSSSNAVCHLLGSPKSVKTAPSITWLFFSVVASAIGIEKAKVLALERRPNTIIQKKVMHEEITLLDDFDTCQIIRMKQSTTKLD